MSKEGSQDSNSGLTPPTEALSTLGMRAWSRQSFGLPGAGDAETGHHPLAASASVPPAGSGDGVFEGGRPCLSGLCAEAGAVMYDREAPFRLEGLTPSLSPDCRECFQMTALSSLWEKLLPMSQPCPGVGCTHG